MDTISEIPADVMKAATECAGNMQGSLDGPDIAVIASAIVAERERCAKVAEELRADLIAGRIRGGE